MHDLKNSDALNELGAFKNIII